MRLIVSAVMLAFVCLLYTPVSVLSEDIPAQAQRGYDVAIEPYVAFLKTQNTSPVDYIMGLFEKYDIVILCERWHPEMTQYDMVCQLASDPRFVRNVGHIFTEIGSSRLQPEVEFFLMSGKLSQARADEKLLSIYPNFTFFPYGEKTKDYGFLGRIHELNTTLPQNEKIHSGYLYRICFLPAVHKSPVSVGNPQSRGQGTWKRGGQEI